MNLVILQLVLFCFVCFLFCFFDKVEYLNLTHGIKEDAFYLHIFFYVSMCVIFNKEVYTKCFS